MHSKVSCDLSDDLLRGAEEIAEFVFGSRKDKRKIYYLAECSRIPVFRLGSVLCARRSVLMAWIARQERAAASEVTAPARSDQTPEHK